jgi:hypothetical protein
MTIADQLSQALRDACKALDVATTPLARDRQEVSRAKVGALAALAAYDAAPDDDAKDAARWRWWRKFWCDDNDDIPEGFMVAGTEEQFDAAIDAARSKP